MKDMIIKKVCNMVHPSLTRQEMIDANTNSEDIKNFIGGAEKPIAFLDTNVPFDFGVDENEQPITKTWREYSYHKESIDGKTVLIHCATPMGYKDGRCISAGRRDETIFLVWTSALGINDMLTKSEFETLYKSDKYTDTIEL